MVKIMKLPLNLDDIYAPRFALIGETGIVIRTFEKRDSAFEYLEHARREGSLQ